MENLGRHRPSLLTRSSRMVFVQTPESDNPGGTPVNAVNTAVNRSFRIADDAFVRDGNNMQIKAGAIHYFRVLPEVVPLLPA